MSEALVKTADSVLSVGESIKQVATRLRNHADSVGAELLHELAAKLEAYSEQLAKASETVSQHAVGAAPTAETGVTDEPETPAEPADDSEAEETPPDPAVNDTAKVDDSGEAHSA